MSETKNRVIANPSFSTGEILKYPRAIYYRRREMEGEEGKEKGKVVVNPAGEGVNSPDEEKKKGIVVSEEFHGSYIVLRLRAGMKKYREIVVFKGIPGDHMDWTMSYEIDFTKVRDELQDSVKKAFRYVLSKRDDADKFFLMNQDNYVSANPRQDQFVAEICSTLHFETYCVSFAFADLFDRELYVLTTEELRARIKAALAELEKKLAEADERYKEEEEARLSQHE